MFYVYKRFVNTFATMVTFAFATIVTRYNKIYPQFHYIYNYLFIYLLFLYIDILKIKLDLFISILQGDIIALIA